MTHCFRCGATLSGLPEHLRGLNVRMSCRACSVPDVDEIIAAMLSGAYDQPGVTVSKKIHQKLQANRRAKIENRI